MTEMELIMVGVSAAPWPKLKPKPISSEPKTAVFLDSMKCVSRET